MEPDAQGAMFEVDADGWIAQHAGRDLNEVVREIIQNALDTGEDITVKIDTRRKQVEVIDEGSGFDNLENAWQVFGGDKAGDPTKRGRFGRGIKELVASTQKTIVETTSGRVEFDVEDRERRTYPDRGRDSGTRVVARNPDWKKRDVKDVYHYVKQFWPPEGQDITVDLKGGNTETLDRPEPEWNERCYLSTVIINDDGKMDKTRQFTDVHVRPASGNSGVLYEMGIPVEREADYPFHVDVQQKILLAEQRNEPDSWWHEHELMPDLAEIVADSLSERQMRKDWFTTALNNSRDADLKEMFVEKVVQDGRKKGLVVSSDDKSDDKAENHGYQVYDTSRAGEAVGSIVESVAESSRSVAKELAERDKQQVSPTSRQKEFIRTVEKLAAKAGYDEITFQTWEIDDTFRQGSTEAQYNEEDHVVKLNVNNRSWEKLTPENIGTALLHEVAHSEGFGHDDAWQNEVERIGGAVILDLLENDD